MVTRQSPRRLLITLLLMATTPVLGMLCRGHTPSRFDPGNLPVWECRPPRQVASIVPPAVDLIDAANIQALSPTPEVPLPRGSDDTLFAVQEALAGSSALASDRREAGLPGQWLQAASLEQPLTSSLRDRMNGIALRLLADQTRDGYLGPARAVGRCTEDEIACHAQNIIGLLAAYRELGNPAMLFGAIRAGHFILQGYDPKRVHYSPDNVTAIVESLVELHQLSDDDDFLTVARTEADTRNIRGEALCALYSATGDRFYYGKARALWKQGDRAPMFCARMYAITGDAYFLGPLVHGNNSYWLPRLAYSRDRKAVSIDILTPSSVVWNKSALIVTQKPDGYQLQVQHPPATPLPIRLPRLAAGWDAYCMTGARSKAIVETDGSARLIVDHVWKPTDCIVFEEIAKTGARAHAPSRSVRLQSLNTRPV